MSQGNPCWSPSEQSGVPVNYAATDAHSIPVWAQDSTDVPSGQLASPEDIFLPPYNTISGQYPCMIEGQDDMGIDHPYYLSQGLTNVESTDITHFSFDGNAHAQLDHHGQCILPLLDIPLAYEATCPLTSSSATDSPQSPADHFSGQESPGIKLADANDQIPLLFDEDGRLQPEGDFHIPPSVAAFLSTICNFNDLSQSPVGPSASPPIVEIPGVEAHLKAVGSSQIQHASGKRRKKDGVHQCPFRNYRNAKNCNATFTARHNLRYHVYAHLGWKPYKCGKCKYAASSPATTKRHQHTCKGTSNSTEGNA